jgi:hypothetical protein
MLKANAWPFSVFEDVEYQLAGATFQGRTLKQNETNRGIIVEARGLRELGDGDVVLAVRILTTPRQIATEVFNGAPSGTIVPGFRVLCEPTKHRLFVPIPDNATETLISIPLAKVRGVVSVTPTFRLSASPDESHFPSGATVGFAKNPIYVTIDEDWTGQEIPIDWLDFAAQNPPLPEESFLHVELSGSGETVPKAWLNKKFEPEIGTIINHAGLNSPQGVARHIFRQFMLAQVWQSALAWAIRHESPDDPDWPASRIARMWRDRFREFGWDLPAKADMTLDITDELSVKIQHCLKVGQELTHVSKLWNF